MLKELEDRTVADRHADGISKLRSVNCHRNDGTVAIETLGKMDCKKPAARMVKNW